MCHLKYDRYIKLLSRLILAGKIVKYASKNEVELLSPSLDEVSKVAHEDSVTSDTYGIRLTIKSKFHKCN